MGSIAENLNGVRYRMAEACLAAGRPLSDVTLLAVSKTKTVSMILEALAAGQALFGESYVQELVTKRAELIERCSEKLGSCEFHLIGPLQSNKAARVVGEVSLIHTVDRIKIAEVLNKAALKKGVRQDILVQVNISGEESKSGVLPGELCRLLEQCCELPALDLRGLMSIGSALDGAAQLVVEREFEQMCELKHKVSSELSLNLPQLSMGMSDDFHLAIKHGATIVRAGSIIFGERA